MPISVRDIDNGLGNLWSGHGVLTGEEYLAATRNFYAQDDNKIASYRFSLSDYTGLTEADISPDEIRAAVHLAQHAIAINNDLAVAIAASGDLPFGLARMWSLLIEDSEWAIRVFRDPDDAKGWLRDHMKERHNVEELTFC